MWLFLFFIIQDCKLILDTSGPLRDGQISHTGTRQNILQSVILQLQLLLATTLKYANKS